MHKKLEFHEILISQRGIVSLKKVEILKFNALSSTPILQKSWRGCYLHNYFIVDIVFTYDV